MAFYMDEAGVADLWEIVAEKCGAIFNHSWIRRSFESGYNVVLADIDMTNNTQKVSNSVLSCYSGDRSTKYTVKYSDKVSFDANGNPYLENPISVSFSQNSFTAANVIAGKYFYNTVTTSVNTTNVYYAYPGQTPQSYANSSYGYCVYFTNTAKVSGSYYEAFGKWETLLAADRNAYTDGIVDGVECRYTGVPFDNAVMASKVAVGAYGGTGTYGEENPNRLTFDFVPKVIFLLGTSSSGTWSSLLGYREYSSNTIMVLDTMTTEYVQRQGFIQNNSADYTHYGRKSADGKTVEWYSTKSSSVQCNVASTKYYYLAIG